MLRFGMDVIELFVDIFRFLHFLGLAALLGGLLVQMRAAPRAVNAAVLHGAIAQMVTGIALLLLTLQDADHLKVTVKLAFLVVILVVILVRRRSTLTPPLFAAVLSLTLVNVGLAVFW